MMMTTLDAKGDFSSEQNKKPQCIFDRWKPFVKRSTPYLGAGKRGGRPRNLFSPCNFSLLHALSSTQAYDKLDILLEIGNHTIETHTHLLFALSVFVSGVDLAKMTAISINCMCASFGIGLNTVFYKGPISSSSLVYTLFFLINSVCALTQRFRFHQKKQTRTFYS